MESKYTYFLGFSIWNEKNICLSWDETIEWFKLLDIQPVKVIYDGIYDEKKVKACWQDNWWHTNEGYVMRLADEVPYAEFRKKVAKFVRPKHIQTVKHWMYGQQIQKNTLKSFWDN